MMNGHRKTPQHVFVARLALLPWFVLCGCAESADVAPQAAPATESVGEALATAQSMREWKFLVIHHTATDSGSVETIDAAHRNRRDSLGRPWRGIGYHFLIGNGSGMGDGEIEATFRWRDQLSGAHAGIAKYNELGIGICLVGNFEQNGPTPAQMEAVTQLVAQLKQRFQITTSQVLRHGDLKATACPGKHFPFAQVAATPADGVQLAAGEVSSRFQRIESSSKEGVSNVVSVQRSRAARQRSQGKHSIESHESRTDESRESRE